MMTPEWHPGFIVIGAVKAATTWIQARLQDNPAIFMPDAEPHYFSSEFDRGEDWYRGFFANRSAQAQVIGEKSADYLAHPLAAHRIARALPQARLVLQLRNPVERAYSDYKMFYRRGTLKGPPEEYLRSMDNPYPRFLEDGLYARHLARWYDLFPREQILIYLYDDVTVQPERIVEAVFESYALERFPDGEAPETEWTYADPIGENWGSVLAQDFSNMQFVQKGMKSSGFRGPLPNPHQEQKVINLHRNLANFMDGMGAPTRLELE